jgi:hypothetical protein
MVDAVRESREVAELSPLDPECETKTPSVRKVLLNQFQHSSRAHDRTPGHGRATAVSADKSTFA